MEPDGSLPSLQQSAPCPYRQWKNPFQALSSYFFNIRYNIILPSTTRYSKLFFSSGFSAKPLYGFLNFTVRATWGRTKCIQNFEWL